MTSAQFKGVIVPILTPLTKDGEVDTGSLRRLVNYQLENKVHGIWAGGTTGEFAALTNKQRLLCIEVIRDEVAGRVPIIANISEPSTQLGVNFGQQIKGMELDGVAATPPYYYPCAQDELLEHYRYTRDSVGMPLWVYNIPVTVKSTVDPATVACLAGEGTVVGIKDSSGAGELLAELNFLSQREGFALWRFLGSVFRTTTTNSLGAHGVIPGLANLVPALFVKAWEAGETGDDSSQQYLEKIVVASKIMKLAKAGGPNASSFSGMKAALNHIGILDYDTVSRPLRPLAEEEKLQIPDILNELRLT
ncbi:MAG: dihydrodipicolinate synthase family protein [SAR202 cluster bacterium]|jgi:4-hydroxy-tetrahydrodipicolinate synthase|nr:dihydrodipicolinate synthase family protein [SAR202 cluster bacterium]